MSRKILQIGSDILTINDKLVSVTEDYPFWKVNLDTSEQYWSALLSDKRPLAPVNFTITNVLFGNINISNFITAPNGLLYGLQGNGTTLYSFDSINKIITPLANFNGTMTGMCLVGDDLIIVPGSATYFAKFNTISNTFITFGDLGSNSEKFGRPCLADNGKVYASPRGVTQWAIIDPVLNDFTLIPQISNGGLTGGCIDGGNEWVYSCSENANNVQSWTKINKNDNTIVSYRPSNNLSYYFKPGGVVDGKIFFYPTAGSGGTSVHKCFTIVDTKNNDTITLVPLLGPTPSGALTDIYSSCVLGMDNYFYLLSKDSRGPAYRYNIYTNVLEIVIPAPINKGYLAGGINKQGQMFWIASDGTLAEVETTYTEVKDNRLLSRLINLG